MKSSRCRICKDPCPEASKLFDPVLGYVCSGCHDFLLYASTRMKRVGIQHVTLKPVRYEKREDAQ